jgi:hypothetical protein
MSAKMKRREFITLLGMSRGPVSTTGTKPNCSNDSFQNFNRI